MPITHTVNMLQYPAGHFASMLHTNSPVDYPELSDQSLQDLLAKAQKENDALWQENEKLREQINSFEAIVIATDMTSIRLVEARVSRYNGDSVNPTIQLLRGSLHGIKQDDAVAFKSNLIGFVTESIGPTSATVSLVTREGFSIGVQVKPPPKPDQVLPPGWPFKTRVKSDGQGGFYCVLAKSVAEGLRPGDYVRASDSIRGSANGFLLGIIEKVEPDGKDPLNLSRVIIKPRAPIGPQRTVTVLTERTD
ncbi:MAG: rod shape-determining protein MreC [Phycisphaeraceae bacterium]